MIIRLMFLLLAGSAFAQAPPPQCPPGMIYGSPTAGCTWRCYCPDGRPSPSCETSDCTGVARAASMLPPPVTAPPAGDMTPGACCRADGGCDVVTATDCSRTRGRWQGPGTACAARACEVLAACCLPSGDCEVTTEAACNERRGAWRALSISCRDASCSQTCAGVMHLLDGRLLDLSGSDASKRETAVPKLAVKGRRLLLSGTRPAELFRSYVESCRALGLEQSLDWGSLVVIHAGAGDALQEKTLSTDMGDWLRRVTPLQKWQDEVSKLVSRPVPDPRRTAEGRGADLACGE